MKKLSVALSLLFALSSATAWAEAPIKIGFLYLMSGRLATAGTTSKQGAEIALEEINAQGGINGRKLEGIFRDSKGDPAVAIEEVKDLVNKERVTAIMGIITSDVALAVSPLCNELKVPLFITAAQTPQVTGNKCNRHTFRITWSNMENLKTAVILAAKTNAKKWTTVAPEYAFGHEAWGAFKYHLKKAKPDTTFVEDSEAVFAPIDTTDWAPYVKKVKDSGADGVAMTLFGGNLIDFLRQAKVDGLFDGTREGIAAVGPITAFLALGTDTPVGIWAVTPYWHKANNSPINQKFVEAYERRFVFPPGFQSLFAYAGVKVYAEAVKQTGTTDSPVVVKALEGMTMELPIGKVTIRPEDHQAVFDVIGGKTSDKVMVTKHKKIFRDLDPLVRFPAEVIAIPVDQTGCRMQ
ncbi:MAG: ABC transporter substrate-binding protein [Desulfomonile tiedjei]|nr:ABC transporter substrate-binding protein [Desulfomonile tiedjei]